MRFFVPENDKRVQHLSHRVFFVIPTKEESSDSGQSNNLTSLEKKE